MSSFIIDVADVQELCKSRMGDGTCSTISRAKIIEFEQNHCLLGTGLIAKPSSEAHESGVKTPGHEYHCFNFKGKSREVLQYY